MITTNALLKFLSVQQNGIHVRTVLCPQPVMGNLHQCLWKLHACPAGEISVQINF